MLEFIKTLYFRSRIVLKILLVRWKRFFSADELTGGHTRRIH
jgi:hypothetical protein